MKNDGYTHVSHKVSSDEIGLGWLTGITEWMTPKATHVHPHKHSHIELIFCLKGAMTYKISGHGSVTIREGSGVVMPADTVHVLEGETDAPCGRLGLHISRSMLPKRRYEVFSPADFRAFHATLAKMSAHPFRLDTKLQSTVKEIVRLVRQDSISSPERGLLRALCCTVLFHVAETLSKPFAAPQPQMMDEAVKFLESHYSKKMTLDALMLHMGYGRTQLFHLFKQHTGLSPNEYLVRFRIKKAKDMLAGSDKPLAAIAKAVGFSSTSYFRSVFLKYEGRKPESFRNMHSLAGTGPAEPS